MVTVLFTNLTFLRGTAECAGFCVLALLLRLLFFSTVGTFLLE